MTVLFLCRRNAGRSQMAQAFFERIAPGHTALSGGSEPTASVHRAVCEYPGRKVEDWGVKERSGPSARHTFGAR